MRRIITFSLLFISVFVGYGSAKCDSVKVLFALNEAIFNPALDNNAASMKRFIDSVALCANSGKLDHVDVYGYTSPDGPYHKNKRLSIQRSDVIADYISRHAGISLSEIQTYPKGVAWDDLRTYVAGNPHTPSRDTVLRILDEYTPAACTDPAISEQCIKSLMAIDDGQTYKWMIENLFPKLRFSLAICKYNNSDSSIVQPIAEKTYNIADAENIEKVENIEPDSLLISKEDTSAISLTPPNFEYNSQIVSPLHRIAIKTNMLYYVALLPNIEVEWRVSDNWSVALEYDMAWWGKYGNKKSYRLAMLSPEVKRWIRPRAPWHGFYVGLFAGGGLYDFENGGTGYRGEGVMTGLSGGFMWPVSRCLSLEAAIGAGYLYTRYKEYKPLDGHHVYQRTKNLHYFGPLKVKFSLVWRLWDVNKSKRQKALKDRTTQYEK